MGKVVYEVAGDEKEENLSALNDLVNQFAREIPFGELRYTEKQLIEMFGTDDLNEVFELLKKRGFMVKALLAETSGIVSVLSAIMGVEKMYVIDSGMPASLDYYTPYEDELALQGHPEDDENVVTAKHVRARLYREFRQKVRNSLCACEMVLTILNANQCRVDSSVVIPIEKTSELARQLNAPYLIEMMSNTAQNAGYTVIQKSFQDETGKNISSMKFIPTEN